MLSEIQKKKKIVFRVLSLTLTLAVALVWATVAQAEPQAGTVTGDKTLSDTDITCGGSTTVTLTLVGQTGIAGDPADIMLVLDRSGSMGGNPIVDLKAAASQFVDTIDEGTDGTLDGIIANGSRIGVVSFAGTATLNQGLTDSAIAVKNAINGLSTGGLTAVGDGINLAQTQLAASSSAFMIVFSDGQSNTGSNPTTAANNAKAAGTEIFTIGLGNSVNQAMMRSWASGDDHYYFAPTSSELGAIFEAIGAAIVIPAGTNIHIVDTFTDHFGGGTFDIYNSELGTETFSASLVVTHDNTKPGGVEVVNESITYSDDEGKTVTFPNPTINVRGCAAHLALTPATADNTVGDTHTVTAVVTDDFGDPVQGITVDFSVAGGASFVDGEASEPTPATGSGLTDANGEAIFAFSNVQAAADTVTAVVGSQANVSSVLEAGADKMWHPIEVAIDIKPNSYPNSYGASSSGKIPVALLGSATFDVYTVDDASVLFGDAPSPFGDAALAQNKGHFEDVNLDGYMDKVFMFWFQETNLDPSDTEGCLGGETNGLDFLGCDSVNIVPE